VSGPVGTTQAARLLIRLRLRRLFNRIEADFRYHMGSADRKAASRASGVPWLLSGLVGLALLGTATLLSYQGLANADIVLGSTRVDRSTPGVEARERAPERPRARSLRRLPPAPGSVLPAGVLQAATFAATLLLLASMLIGVANRDVTRAEGDLEWLVTLPLPLSTLLMSRLIERVATHAAGLLFLGPFLSVLAWKCGYRWTAPLVGVGLTLALLFLVATAQGLIDTGLRMSLSPRKLRNLHAAIALVSLPPMLVVTSMVMPQAKLVFGWASALPEWATWLPAGLAVRALASADGTMAALYFALMIAEILALVAAGGLLLHRQIRRGVVLAGVREAAARLPRPARQAPPSRPTTTRVPISAVQRRELRLLGRDRTFMAQTLVMPALIVGLQVFLGASTNVFAAAVEHPANLAAIAFGLAAYTLAFSAFQTLNAEGHALWVLYCVPHSLESVLWQKTKFWAAVAAIYPLVIFAIAIATAGGISVQFLGTAGVVLIGVPIFAVIASALGVFGCNPLEPDVRRRIHISYLYLYTLIASFYIYAVYAVDVWQRTALIILTALVAIALWQRARDHLAYLLDPSASPPSTLSLSDGLFAALMFFALQALVLVPVRADGNPTADMLLVAFCVAGAATYGAMRLFYSRGRVAGFPRMLGAGLPQAVLLGIGAGVAAALAALAYLGIAGATHLFPVAPRMGTVPNFSAAVAIAALAIIVAPVFEEFIFRGLVFRGLRRSLGLAAATVASAGIFAIVHAEASFIPVFVMSVCAALVYERTGMLAAPIVVHAIYNAAILGFRWNMLP
jgi:ABC-2 type transport system permease protein